MTTSALEKIKELIQTTENFKTLETACKARKDLSIKNAHGSLAAIITSSLYHKTNQPFLCVVPESDQAEKLKDELAELTTDLEVTYFPESKFLPRGHRDTPSLSQQLEVIEQLLEHKRFVDINSDNAKFPSPVIVATCQSVTSELVPPENLQARRLDLKTGEELPFDTLLEQLTEMGFERERVVEEPGDMSVRGGIIDIFPYSRTIPIRIEFWGDEIESIREFDSVTQRSERQIATAVLLPQEISHINKSTGEDDTPTSTLIDFLPQDTILCIFTPEKISSLLKKASGIDTSDDETWLEVESKNTKKDASALEEFYDHFKRFPKLSFTQLKPVEGQPVVDMKAIPQQTMHGNLKTLCQQLEFFSKGSKSNHQSNQSEFPGLSQTNSKLFFVCESSTHAERIAELFSERDLSQFNISVFAAALHGGFSISSAQIAVFTDHEFYGRIRSLQKRRKYSRGGLTQRQLKSLSKGDYVVHVDHGIGVFKGLERIGMGNQERECLIIHYHGEDKLFVPLDKMDRVQKYTAKEAVAPRIHKLGSPDWEKLKNKTKKRMKDIADDLIKLYAARQEEKGFAYSQDTHWQRELEASFPYEDTPDQAKAVEDVKVDMEKERPMDRLVCGDVGFGKTEVAIRAAFKAVQDKKQVAVLVPTTLLAQQHFSTFKERLQRIPVNIEVLSRFRTQAEQRKILQRLKEGDVDIIIGTHRLLSKDVEFKDLGLLVVDEEQQFGVRHKEKLKELRISVDILTLSATPIPRTLHMALMSVRDMSTITTPPRDRLPIHTEVAQFDNQLVRQAILREVHRGGQIFFVHNRVQSIYNTAALLEKLIPEVEIGIAHGQMKEHDLEEKILDFIDKKFHVLVSTMIIESGLDMPNVNTIMVNRAHRFGLAQLYQLRGRVGRSYQKAYCYLLVPPIENLSVEAIKRLETIEEFTDLGSGFQIALRDLEIRGAGNLLGGEQSGMIDAVGFDLYSKILKEAMQEVDNPVASATPEKKRNCKVELKGDAFLPEEYVDVAEERVAIYRRLAEADDIIEIENVREELKDRFGRLPEPAKNLLGLVSLRLLGSALGLQKLKVSLKESRAKFIDEIQPTNGKTFKEWIGTLVQHAPYPIEFFQNDGLGFCISPPKNKPMLDSTIELLKEITQVH